MSLDGTQVEGVREQRFEGKAKQSRSVHLES